MPSQHHSKKQYNGLHAQQQMGIKSYFNVAAPFSDTNPKTSYKSDHLNVYSPPPVPDCVASDLLNVGMRVRKSVTDGYKTDSQYNMFTRQQTAQKTSHRLPVCVTPAPAPLASTSIPRQQELAPFCGLNKTGGLSQQDDLLEEDDVPYFSSQASTITSSSISEAIAAKRRYLDEEAESDDDDTDMVSVNLPANRPIAVPARLKSAMYSRYGSKMDNTVPVSNVTIAEFNDEDFEEAGFLMGQSSDEIEMDE